MSRLSSAEGTTTDAAEEAEPEPVDEEREALLATLQTDLGDALVGSHIRTG